MADFSLGFCTARRLAEPLHQKLPSRYSAMNIAAGIFLLCGFAAGTAMAGPIVRVDAGDPISQSCINPMKGDFYTPEQAGMAVEEVRFKNAAGHNLRGWFFPNAQATESILFCMGNTGNISLMLPYARIFQQSGYEVLLFDYQGFGDSEGVAVVGSLLSDSLAACDFLIEHSGRPADQTGIFGVSLGSILALAVAAERSLGAVAVESVFLPEQEVDRFARHQVENNPAAALGLRIAKSLLLGRVDPVRNVSRLRCPVFFLHGVQDRLLRATGSVQVYNAMDGPRRLWLMPSTGHAPESLEVNDREYKSQLRAFFREAFSENFDQIHVRNLKFSSPSENQRLNATCELWLPTWQHETAVQLCLIDARGRTSFRNLWVAAARDGEKRKGGRVVRVRVSGLGFRPEQAYAVRCHHVTDDRPSWKSDLSDFSAALIEYKRCSRRILNGDQAERILTAKHGMHFNRYQYLVPRFPHRSVTELLQSVEQIESAPPRIQARYARLLARLHCWPEARLDGAESQLRDACGECMMKFLPEDPDAYYELRDADLQLTFRDVVVGDSLFRLAKNRLRDGRVQEARDLLQKHVSVLPAEIPTNLTEQRIQSIMTPDDLN